MCQGTSSLPSITINDYELEVVEEFTYLGSTLTSNLSLHSEINKRIGKASSTFFRLTTRVWENAHLTTETKIAVCSACIISMLLYGSKSWTTYARHEKKLHSFHLRCLRKILNIWEDKVTHVEVLTRAGLKSIYPLLQQRWLRWLGHDRWWTHSQRHPVWKTNVRQKNNWASQAEIQRCV